MVVGIRDRLLQPPPPTRGVARQIELGGPRFRFWRVEGERAHREIVQLWGCGRYEAWAGQVYCTPEGWR